jgi:hypothetical protein
VINLIALRSDLSRPWMGMAKKRLGREVLLRHAPSLASVLKRMCRTVSSMAEINQLMSPR